VIIIQQPEILDFLPNKLGFCVYSCIVFKNNLISELAGMLVGSCVHDRTQRIASEYTGDYNEFVGICLMVVLTPIKTDYMVSRNFFNTKGIFSL